MAWVLVVGSALGALLGVASAVVRGLVLAKLWEWFVQDPLGVPGLSAAHAIGLSVLVNLLVSTTHLATRSDVRGGEEAAGDPWKPIFLMFASPLLALLTALVVVQFR